MTAQSGMLERNIAALQKRVPFFVQSSIIARVITLRIYIWLSFEPAGFHTHPFLWPRNRKRQRIICKEETSKTTCPTASYSALGCSDGVRQTKEYGCKNQKGIFRMGLFLQFSLKRGPPTSWDWPTPNSHCSGYSGYTHSVQGFIFLLIRIVASWYSCE